MANTERALVFIAKTLKKVVILATIEWPESSVNEPLTVNFSTNLIDVNKTKVYFGLIKKST